MYKALFLISVVCFLLGCGEKTPEESIDFMEPQPVDQKNQPSFNKHYRGVYVNSENNSILRIEEHEIIQSITDPITFSIHDIDSSIKADRADTRALEAALSDNYTIKITKIENDSAYGFISFVDTIFAISKNNLCRFYKGSYFLNYTNQYVMWKVKRLDLNKNKLSIGMIVPTDSLFNIYPIQKKYSSKEQYLNEDDTINIVHYTIAPTKKEFKKLVNENYFTEWEVWIKQKE